MTEAQKEPHDELAPVPDERIAPRSSLMCRTAKILCETGEYVCVVRDVSATGCKLRLFHAAPPEDHLFLELANGERYAMERVWHNGDNLGFRFSCTIDVDQFIAEPSGYARRPIRLNLKRPADLIVDGVALPAVLLDLSQQGARVEAGRKFAIEQKLTLAIDGQPQRFGCVRWRDGYTHGLALQEIFRLDELAQAALALQPFDAPEPFDAPATAVSLARYG
jgi:hypothetical protein